MGRIDPHVHCRDGAQAYKTTIEKVFRLADEQDVEKIFDMPNTDPAILGPRNVEERLKLVPQSRRGDYFLYVGATPNREQLQEALKCYTNFTQVIGIKMFAGESTGDLKIIEPGRQRAVYRILTELGYDGVLAVHCEKEALMKRDLWDPSNPVTHCYARPKEAEIEAVRDQIVFAMETGFPGTLHICHASCPETVELVDGARRRLRISCAVTPHHIMWADDMMEGNGEAGLDYKMNPPLRPADSVMGLMDCLRAGKVDWIETDHAQHSPEEKRPPKCLSGHPSLCLYRQFVEEYLPGIGITNEQIEAMTYGNIVRAFRELR